MVIIIEILIEYDQLLIFNNISNLKQFRNSTSKFNHINYGIFTTCNRVRQLLVRDNTGKNQILDLNTPNPKPVILPDQEPPSQSPKGPPKPPITIEIPGFFRIYIMILIIICT